jgi:hypothetical protein
MRNSNPARGDSPRCILGAPPLVPVALGFANNFFDDLQKMKIDVVTIAPLHGNVAPWTEFPKALGKSGD